MKNSFFFFFHRSVHKVILEKEYFEAFLLKITSICNLKKVLNTAKKEQLAFLQRGHKGHKVVYNQAVCFLSSQVKTDKSKLNQKKYMTSFNSICFFLHKIQSIITINTIVEFPEDFEKCEDQITLIKLYNTTDYTMKEK